MSNDNKYIMRHARGELGHFEFMKYKMECSNLWSLADDTCQWVQDQIETWIDRVEATDPDSSIKPKWWCELGMDYKKEHGYSV